MVTYYQCKLHDRNIIQLEDFGLVHAIEDACNFFRWRDREDVDIRSKYAILRLAKRIKELKEALTCYESRVESNQVMMKEKKKKACCNLKLIVLIVIVCFLFLSLTKNVKHGSCRCVQPKLP
ncbi:hypothetical protein H5410_001239 [Solanum commersonii]|uniref:Uncharacterized protein n=1 Tax=Solanum commersonii TaxID=4109 RepID=A0A9J6AZ03_SOLCO|nr:hypothetical protein H5410_001239 [Solanum commersonii]